MSELPLHGVRVLDCSRVLAGPFAAMLLGDLGADVIKVEAPGGDESREWGPPFWGDPSDRMSAYYSAVNRNKRSVVLDLKAPASRPVLDRLLGRSDLLVHNFRPPTAVRLGLDEARLASRHAHLVVAAVGGFPKASTESDRPAYDLLAQAVSGLMSITGEPDGAPSRVGVAVLDIIAGLQLAVGALAALRGRGSNGTRVVDVSLIEAGVSSLVNVVANYLASGVEDARHGNAHPNIYPYQIFSASDGYIVVTAGNDGQFQSLVTALGLSTADGRFASNADRVRRRSEVVQWLAGAIRNRQRDELVDSLRAANVPAGPVLSVRDAVANMEAYYSGRWIQTDDEMRLAPGPIRIDGAALPLRRRPPRLGEHSEEVLMEIGLDLKEIRLLAKQGVTHNPAPQPTSARG